MLSRIFGLIALSAAVLVSTACNESSLSRPGVTEVHFQAPPTEVDILLVVDDSCSMQAEQAQLSEGFENFIEFFDVADVDYHIGVITTDTVSPARSGRLVDAGGASVITRDTEDAEDVFRDNVQVGIQGYGFEKGLDAAAAAFSESLLEDENAGFLREDAYLSVIFISDEEDVSEYGVNSYINFFFDLKGQRTRDVFNASSLVGLNTESLEPEECGRVVSDPNAGADPGFRYHDVAMQTGGVVGSICEDDFYDIVTQMGLASSRLLDRFVLDRRPRPDSIEMTVFVPDDDEGEVVPPEGTEAGEFAWEYLEDEEAQEFTIRFTDLSSLPPIDSRIVLHYELF